MYERSYDIPGMFHLWTMLDQQIASQTEEEEEKDTGAWASVSGVSCLRKHACVTVKVSLVRK